MASGDNSTVLTERATVKKLRHLGRKLPKYLDSGDKLLELLHKLELVLSTVDQEPSNQIKESLVPLMKALISAELLRHTDEHIKILVTACLIEITRITAPNAPYDGEPMKELLKLAVATFEKLSHVSGHNYQKALTILKNVSTFQIFLIMLDLECNDLIIEMFQHFFRIIRSNHSSNVIDSMEVIMTMTLNESEEISPELLRPLLESARKENQTLLPISWTLAEKVITNCAVKLKPFLMQAVESSGRALDEYAEIVTSICQNQSESSEHNHSIGSRERLVQEVENNLNVPEDADEEPRDVPGRPETDNTCMRDAEIMDDSKYNIRKTSASAMDGEVTKASGSKRKPHSGLTKNSKRSNAKTISETGNLESGQELNSETLLDTVPRKRSRKPNSLMNPEEGYNHAWIYMETSTGKSSRSRKDHDSSSALSPSRKDKMRPKPKTVSEVIVTKPKNETIAKPSQSRKICNIGSDFPSCENPAFIKGIEPSNPEDMSKVLEDLVAKAKTDENIDAAPLTNHKTPDGSFPHKGRPSKIRSTGNQDDHPNSVSILKKSKVCKDSEVKPQAPFKKLSVKIGGKAVVSPDLVVATSESQVFCEDERKNQSDMNTKVEVREEGRSSAQTEGKKRRIHNATSNKGLNSSSAMKGRGIESASKTLSAVDANQHTEMQRRRITVPESEDLANSLVGKRIKVWWPLDKTYYEGRVYSYYPAKRKHTILYDDGGEELLNLKKERYELIDAYVSPDEEEGVGLQKLAEASDIEKQSIQKSKMESLKSAQINLCRSDFADESIDDPPRTVGREDSDGKPKTKRMKTGSHIKKNKPKTIDNEKEKAQGT